MLIATLCAIGPEAEATNVRVRTISVGQATHYFRADEAVAAPRIFTQGLSLWGYDLLDDQTGAANAHVSFRYTNDFSLDAAERNDPLFAHRWNELMLDVAYLDWEPLEAMRLRMGRQWKMGSLGVHDFDGLDWQWRPRLETGTRAHFEAHAGRDVQTAFGRLDPDHFDVQGLPPDDRLEPHKLEGTHLVAGAGAGMQFDRLASFEFNWRRRFSVGVDSPHLDDDDDVVGSEQVGAALSASFRPDLVGSAHGSYHAQLRGIDRAGAQLTWSPVSWPNTVTAGVDHRRPWFDSSSIFNLFGARPHQGAFLIYGHPVDALRTSFELRSWGRIYHGDDAATAPNIIARDERTLGSAAGHTSRIHLFERPVQWRSLVSYQTSLDRPSDQVLGDVRLRAPIWRRDVFLSVRGLALAALGERHRRDDGYATTGVLGLDVPLGPEATLSAAVETSGGSLYPLHTNAYATFTLEHWP